MLYSKALIIALGVAGVSAATNDSRISSNHGTLQLVTSSGNLATDAPTLTAVTSMTTQSTVLDENTESTTPLFIRYVSDVVSGEEDAVSGTPTVVSTNAATRLAVKLDGAHVAGHEDDKGVAVKFFYGTVGSANKVEFAAAAGSTGTLASNVLSNSLAVANGQTQITIEGAGTAVTMLIAPTKTNAWYYQCGMKLSWAVKEGADAIGLLTDSDNQAAALAACSCKITQDVHLTVNEPAADVEFATLNINGCTESLLDRYITVEFSKAGTSANTYIATTTDDLEIKQELAQFQVKGAPANAVDSVASATGTTYKTMSFNLTGATDFHDSTSLILKTKTGTTDAYKQTAENVYIRLLSSRDALANNTAFSGMNSPNFIQDEAEWVQLGVNGSMQSVSIFSAFLAMAGSFLI